MDDLMKALMYDIQKHGGIVLDGWTGDKTRQAVLRLELEGRVKTELKFGDQYTYVQVTEVKQANG